MKRKIMPPTNTGSIGGAITPPVASPTTESPWQIWSSPETTGPPTGADRLHRQTSQTSLSSLSVCADKNEPSTASPRFDVDDDFDMKSNDLMLSMKALHIGDDDNMKSQAGPICARSRDSVSTPSKLDRVETKYARKESLKQDLHGVGAMHEFEDHRLAAPQTFLQEQECSEECVQLTQITGSSRKILDSLLGLTLEDPAPCEAGIKPEALITSATDTNLRVEINLVEDYDVNSDNRNDPEQISHEPNNSNDDEYAVPNWDLDFEIDCSESFDFGLVDPLLRDEMGSGHPSEPEPLELANPDITAIGDHNALPIQDFRAQADPRAVQSAQGASSRIPATPDS
jgi:hypothetical protein